MPHIRRHEDLFGAQSFSTHQLAEVNHKEHTGHKVILCALCIAILESFRGLRKFSGGPWLSKK
jgi:hypothetical protein